MKYTIVVLLLAGLMTVGCGTTKRSGAGPSDSGDLLGNSAIDDRSMAEGTYPQEVNRELFAPVFFDYDSTQVKPGEGGKCEQVAKYLKKREAKGVVLEGHADERGSREYNLALGEVRALAIRDYLINLGVDASTIHTRSYGEETPASKGHDEASWSQNRQVVFGIY